jgi:subtilisin family serine protease
LVFVLLLVAASLALLGPKVNVDDSLPGHYIVVYKDDIALSTIESHKSTVLSFDGSNQIKFTYTDSIRGFAGNFSKDTVQYLSQRPEVKYVVNDGIARITQDCGRQPVSSSLWGLGRISHYSRSPSNNYDIYNFPSSGGNGVRAYILDTGIYCQHNDLRDRCVYGFNAVDNIEGDQNGHGTHVASTVGGTMYGVAKQSTLVAVKVLNAGGSGTWAGVIAGIDYVAREGTPNNDVANMSLGGATNFAVDDAVVAAVQKGIWFAVAAGNDYGADACRTSPAGSKGSFTVGATQVNDNRATFSNIGTCVNAFAPGQSIQGAWIGNPSATNIISGTSMASPHACGIAALYLGLPGDVPMSPADVTAHLETISTPNVINGGLNSPNRLMYVGQPCGGQ